MGACIGSYSTAERVSTDGSPGCAASDGLPGRTRSGRQNRCGNNLTAVTFPKPTALLSFRNQRRSRRLGKEWGPTDVSNPTGRGTGARVRLERSEVRAVREYLWPTNSELRPALQARVAKEIRVSPLRSLRGSSDFVGATVFNRLAQSSLPSADASARLTIATPAASGRAKSNTAATAGCSS